MNSLSDLLKSIAVIRAKVELQYGFNMTPIRLVAAIIPRRPNVMHKLTAFPLNIKNQIYSIKIIIYII